MAITHAMAFIDEIKMRIEMNDVDGAHRIEGLDDRCVDRVVTTEDHGHRSGGEDRADRKLGLAWLFAMSVWTMSVSPTSTIRT